MAVVGLERHTGRPVALLLEDSDERWTVERGLQLCAQNALDALVGLDTLRGRVVD